MDTFQFARRVRRARHSRPRRTCSPTVLEALEERTLLSLTLIKDLNPMPLFPADITGAGEKVYFVTTAADGGADLDVQTGSSATVLKEFSGSNSVISDLTPDGSRLYFFASIHKGQQLWVTDGTRAGTRVVKIMNPSVLLSDPTVVGNELYFISAKETLLYKSNGTDAGTVPVAMPAGFAKSGNAPDNLVNYGGVLYFDLGDQLMKSSGTMTKVVDSLGPPPLKTSQDRVRRQSDRGRRIALLHVLRRIRSEH